MKRRNFTATSLGLLLGSSLTTGLSNPSIGVSFTTNKSELDVPANTVQSIIIEFESMTLKPNYINSSDPVTINYGLVIESEQQKSKDRTIRKKLENGESTDISNELQNLKLGNLSIDSDSVGGYIYVDISHSSGISERYIDRFTISGFGVDEGLTNYWPVKQSDTESRIEDVKGQQDGELIGSGSILTNDSTEAKFTGGYIKLPNVTIEESFTVSVWCKSRNTNWSNSGVIASSRQHNGFIVHADSNSSQWSGYAMENSGSNNYQKINQVSIGDISNWNHYVLTYDHNSKEGNMYLNGNYKESGSLTVSRDSTDTINIYLGSDDPELDFGSRTLEGSISDFRMYNRVLSEPNVSNLYSLGRT